jgi:hypothetical protein
MIGSVMIGPLTLSPFSGLKFDGVPALGTVAVTDPPKISTGADRSARRPAAPPRT